MSLAIEQPTFHPIAAHHAGKCLHRYNKVLSDDIKAQFAAKFRDPWGRNFILEPEAGNAASTLGISALHLYRAVQATL